MLGCGKTSKDERGDSLIEVLLSLSVLTLVILIAWGIVNRAANINLAARQRVVMVNALREQAEILQARYASESTRGALVDDSSGSIPESLPLVSNDYTTVVPANPCSSKNSEGIPAPESAFHYNDAANPVAGIRSNVAGYQNSYLWIQKRSSREDPPKGEYVDFYVRACWQSTGSTQTDDSSHLIVRFNR